MIRWLRTFVGIALVVATSVGFAWAARQYVTMSARFAVQRIDVTGNERRGESDLIAEGGLALGTNIFAVDLDSARAKLLSDPWIVDVTLARRLPGTILLHVTERKAVAIVSIGEMLLADADGQPFKALESSDPVDLPVVTGLGPEVLAADREGAAHAIRRAIDLAVEFERSGLEKRAPLQEVHIGADGAFTLVVGHTAVELVLGGPPFRRKLDQAARVFAELDKRGGKADAIMLDNDTRPERVVVRMR